MSETTAEIDVKEWAGSTYNRWLEHFEGNSYRALEQVFLHLDYLGQRNLSSMKDVAGELKDVAGGEVFDHKVRDWLSPTTIKNSLQKRFLAVARKTFEEK